LLEDGTEIQALIEASNNGKLNIGVHFPLKAGGWRLRDPQFLSKDDEVRKSSYDYMSDELDFLKDVKPKYVLCHYPKPVLLDESVDWAN